jgi:hypothetical protein
LFALQSPLALLGTPQALLGVQGQLLLPQRLERLSAGATRFTQTSIDGKLLPAHGLLRRFGLSDGTALRRQRLPLAGDGLGQIVLLGGWALT